MDKEKIEALIMKYNEGLADPSEQKLIEQLIEEGVIELSQLSDIGALNERVMSMQFPSPSLDLDDKFHAMLTELKRKRQGFSWSRFFSWPEFAPKLAFASITLLIGLAFGYFLNPSTPNKQVEQLSNQVSDLQEMMMLSLLETGSATDRLKAVNLTQEMDEASNKVTQALIQTLNRDENTNVRLAALEALKPYVKSSTVRQELIKSIAKQESPLIQVALAELMVELQEKASVKELQKILDNDRTPADVKKRIEESLNVLI
jgi:hypothetical protein